MRYPTLFLLASLSMAHAQVGSEHLLTETEALAIVRAERAEEEASYRARRAALEAVPALDERVIQMDDRKVIVRRVSAQDAPIVDTAAEPAVDLAAPAPVDPAQVIAAGPVPETLSLSTLVYGDKHSQVQWRADHRSEPIIVWTNISLRYLPPFTNFEHGGYDYTNFQFTEQIDYAAEQQRVAQAAEQGLTIESRWQEPPVSLSDETYEYVVIADDAAAVPEKLHRQLTALFTYYLERKDTLEIRHKNSEILQAARQKDALENPEQPRDSVTNFWPGKNSVYLNKDEN